MKELIKKTETYKVDTEEEALDMIQSYKDQARVEPFEVLKASYDKKNKKQKGEIIDEWVLVNITFSYE